MTATPGNRTNTNEGEASEAERWASLIGGGTMVLMGLKQYNPPGGALASVFAKLFGEEPEQQIGDENK